MSEGINIKNIQSPFIEKVKEQVAAASADVSGDSTVSSDTTQADTASLAPSESGAQSIFGNLFAGSKNEAIDDETAIEMIVEAAGDDGVLAQEEQDALFTAWGITSESEEEQTQKSEKINIINKN